MKASKLTTVSLAVFALWGAGAVFAADPATRADVRKEAIASGPVWSKSLPEAGSPAMPTRGTKARVDVRSERNMAARSGGLRIDTEGGAPVMTSKSTRPRAEVRAERAEANRDRKLFIVDTQ